MRLRIVLTIFRKELMDTLRDRRAIALMLLIPLVIMPIGILVTGALVKAVASERKSEQKTVAIWGPVSDATVTDLGHDMSLRVTHRRATVPGESSRESEAQALIDRGLAEAVVMASDEKLLIYYDQANDRSSDLKDELEAALRKRAIHEHAFTSDQRMVAFVAARLLPLAMVYVLMVVGLLPAVDLTAGEKERGTMQTLLCAPVSSLEIVTGKYLAVVTFSIAAALFNFIAMSLSIVRLLESLSHTHVSLDSSTLVAVFVTILPMVLLVSALLLTFAVFARSYREANTYLMPIVLLIMIPAVAANMPFTHLHAANACVPMLNLLLLAKDLILGHVPMRLIVVAVSSSLFYAAAAVIFAARVFETEQVLLGGENPWRDVFGRSSGERRTPSPRNAILFFGFALVVTYYATVTFESRGVFAMILGQQLGCFLLPAILWAVVFRFDLRETFSLKLPSARGLGGGMLLVLGAWSVGQLILLGELRFFPGAEASARELGEMFGKIDLKLGLLIAIAPALCEEACFRGVVLSGMANSGSRWTAIVVTGFLFGVVHVNPYQIATAAALGMILSAATLETGCIFISVFIHFANNGLRVLQDSHPALDSLLERPWMIAAGLAATLFGLYLIRGSRRREDR